MKNIIIGIFIVALYFGNTYICDYFYSNDVNKSWFLYVSILSIIIVIALKYKHNGNFIEKLFISIVLNNAYVLVVKNEHSYTLNDVWFIALFTLAQYLKKEKQNEQID